MLSVGYGQASATAKNLLVVDYIALYGWNLGASNSFSDQNWRVYVLLTGIGVFSRRSLLGRLRTSRLNRRRLFSQGVADYYINHHGEDPLYLPVMTYHLLQAEARSVACCTSQRS